MNYTKPEVAVLGKAARVIEFVGSKPSNQVIDGHVKTLPAYDLDE